MEEYDYLMIIDFLEANYSAFQLFLEDRFEIDGAEAELMIEKLKAAQKGEQ